MATGLAFAQLSHAAALAIPSTGTITASQFATRTAGGAIANNGWNIWSNGYLEQSIQFPTTGTYTLSVNAEGTSAVNVNPNLQFSLDGTSLANIGVGAKAAYTASALKRSITAGAHTVRIAFTNDYYDSAAGADRNLIIYSLKIVSPTSSTTSPPPTTTTPTTPASTNPLAGVSFYVNPYSGPANALSSYASGSADWKRLKTIADHSGPMWLGDWNSLEDTQSLVTDVLSQSDTAKQMPVFVIYAIPNRDCGSYSAGGYPDKTSYMNFVNTIITKIGTHKAVILYEPDALPMSIECPTTGRTDIMKSALAALTAKSNLYVYLDAGNSNYASADNLKPLIAQVDPNGKLRGYSLNISNFQTTANEIAFCKKLSTTKTCVIDTSRNGNGPTADNQWCNPTGRAIGKFPTSVTNDSRIDAFLWVKVPGDSDGTCNGGPDAGTYVPSFGIEMARNAGF
jgi:endoglucanase